MPTRIGVNAVVGLRHRIAVGGARRRDRDAVLATERVVVDVGRRVLVNDVGLVLNARDVGRRVLHVLLVAGKRHVVRIRVHIGDVAVRQRDDIARVNADIVTSRSDGGDLRLVDGRVGAAVEGKRQRGRDHGQQGESRDRHVVFLSSGSVTRGCRIMSTICHMTMPRSPR